jgi:Rieske Fe-S protein
MNTTMNDRRGGLVHQDAPKTVTDDGVHAATELTGPDAGPDRRRVMLLGAAAGLGVAGVAGLAACGSGSSAGAGASSAVASAPAASGSGGGALAKLADVPVGGSVAAAGPDGKPIVISQPQAGTVVAFSAVCTHQGCKVAPAGKTLDCPCHGSTFDAFTGKNLSGPAPTPLPAVAVKVSGTDVVAG